MNNLLIEEFGLLSVTEVENHRLSGELYVQYQVPELGVSESCRFVLILHRAEEGIKDLRNVSLKKIESIFKRKLVRILSSIAKSKFAVRNQRAKGKAVGNSRSK